MVWLKGSVMMMNQGLTALPMLTIQMKKTGLAYCFALTAQALPAVG